MKILTIVYLKAGSEELTDLKVWSPATRTLLGRDHLLSELGEEFGLSVPSKEAVLDLGQHGVGARLAVPLLPHQADTNTVSDVQHLWCQSDTPAIGPGVITLY